MPLILTPLAKQQGRVSGGGTAMLCSLCSAVLSPELLWEVGMLSTMPFPLQSCYLPSLTGLCFSSFCFRKLHPLQMVLPGRAPGRCPLGKAMLCTLSSDRATFPSLSSTKAPRAGSRAPSLPLPSLGHSDSEPRQLQRLLRGLSHLFGVWRKPASQINSVDRRQQLGQPSPQPPTDLR